MGTPSSFQAIHRLTFMDTLERAGYVPRKPLEISMNNILLVPIQILAVLFSIVLHEVSHGLMALHLGDRTAKDLGRLTLNPIKHLDLFGSIILPLFTFFAGGFIFGYAKPVPYNPYNLRDKKYGPAKVAMAGPLTNITLAILIGLVIRFLDFSGWAVSVQFVELLQFIVLMNLVLTVFNLVPIPPLDGHWLVLTFVPDRYYQFKQAYARSGWFVFVLFILFGFALILPLVFWLFRLIVGS